MRNFFREPGDGLGDVLSRIGALSTLTQCFDELDARRPELNRQIRRQRLFINMRQRVEQFPERAADDDILGNVLREQRELRPILWRNSSELLKWTWAG